MPSVVLWYAGNIGFNLGMKRSHALVADVVMLTTLQFGAGAALALAVSILSSRTQTPMTGWLRPIVWSSALFLAGTLCTNISLIMISVSFTHVIKTCEPFFTVVIVCMWDRKWPSVTVVLSVLITAGGVGMASTAQRRSAGKANAVNFQVGVLVAMLANAFLQSRNVLNKRLIQPSSSAATSKRPDDLMSPPMIAPPQPMELILATFVVALPMQAALHAAVFTAHALEPTSLTVSRYVNHGNAHPLWLIATPVAFVCYQVASILVLSRVDPVMHAVLNAIKRMVVIGLSAAVTQESILLPQPQP